MNRRALGPLIVLAVCAILGLNVFADGLSNGGLKAPSLAPKLSTLSVTSDAGVGGNLSVAGNLEVASAKSLCLNGSTCSAFWQFSSNLLQTNSHVYIGGGGSLNIISSVQNSSAGVPFRVDDAEGLKLTPKTLPTCTSALEWTQLPDAASGVSTSKRSKMCMCTSDGGGTPAYAWQNLATGTIGTTTTCGTE